MNDTKQALEAVVGQIEHRPSGAYSYPSGLGAEAVSVIARHGPALIAALDQVAQLRAALGESDWLPIDTAPESGPDIFAVSQSSRVSIEAPAFIQTMIRAAKEDGDTSWFTHWRPLPAPPAIDAMAAGGEQPEPPQ